VPPGFHRHDGGFLRFHLGGSAAETKGTGFTISGPAASFAFAGGYSLSDSFVVYAEMFDEVDARPKVNGQSVPAGNSVTHTLVGVGVGVAYYFVPFNAYIGFTGGVGAVNLDVNGQTFSTENGAIFRFSVGKEWWASDNWGLGIAFNFTTGSMKDKGTNPDTLKSSAFGLAFSATYN
jgi:hypothetical protein